MDDTGQHMGFSVFDKICDVTICENLEEVRQDLYEILEQFDHELTVCDNHIVVTLKKLHDLPLFRTLVIRSSMHIQGHRYRKDE